MYVCMYVYKVESFYICMHVCMYLMILYAIGNCMYVCMYVCMYAYPIQGSGACDRGAAAGDAGRLDLRGIRAHDDGSASGEEQDSALDAGEGAALPYLHAYIHTYHYVFYRENK